MIIINYNELTKYDLHTKIYLITTEFGGRKSAALDGYRGQFFWHINNENCSDWDASYIFENGPLNPCEESHCKILLSANVKKYSKGVFPVERQFGIREGAKIIGDGVILKSNAKYASKVARYHSLGHPERCTLWMPLN